MTKKSNRCKVCQSPNVLKVNELLESGTKAVDIIELFPEFSNSNISVHKNNHLNVSLSSKFKAILNNSLDNIDEIKSTNVGDLLRLAEYVSANPDDSRIMNKFHSELDYRMSCLEEILKMFCFVDDYQYVSGPTNGNVSIKDNLNDAKLSILSVVRTVMSIPLDNGQIPINDVINSILGLGQSTRIYDDIDPNNDST